MTLKNGYFIIFIHEFHIKSTHVKNSFRSITVTDVIPDDRSTMPGVMIYSHAACLVCECAINLSILTCAIIRTVTTQSYDVHRK